MGNAKAVYSAGSELAFGNITNWEFRRIIDMGMRNRSLADEVRFFQDNVWYTFDEMVAKLK